MKKKIVEQAEYLLKSTYTICPGPEAEVAIPIIQGLLIEIEWLNMKLKRIGALSET